MERIRVEPASEVGQVKVLLSQKYPSRIISFAAIHEEEIVIDSLKIGKTVSNIW